MDKVELDHVLKTVFPVIVDMPSLKNPFPKRKRGNRLVISFAKQLGEIGFNQEPMVLKLIIAILHDNNYKIRLDGILFLKEYLKIESVQKHQRFKSVYLPELLELLNDEEAYIRIEAIDIMTDLLDFFDLS